MSTSFRMRAVATCVVIAFFTSGAVVGGALARASASSGIAIRVARGAGVDSDLSRLGLSGAQRSRIDARIAAARPQTEAELEAFVVRLQAVADSLDRDVRSELTAAQRSTLDSLVRAHGRRYGPTLLIKRPRDTTRLRAESTEVKRR